MANINETPIWRDGVLEIATTDEVKGGPDGVINQQASQLADRTAYLKQQVEAAGAVAADADTKASTVLERITAVEADVGTAQSAAVLASQHKDAALVARDAALAAQGDAEAAAALAADKAQAAADALDDVFLKNQQTVAAAASAAASAASVAEGKDYILTARGEVLAAVADVESGAAAAAASVTAATAQADRATTQANLATSNGAAQVALAQAQVVAAGSSAFVASKASSDAQISASAALASAKTYASTTAGIAATTSGQVFLVSTGDPQVYTAYSNNSGSAALIGQLNIADARLITKDSDSAYMYEFMDSVGNVVLAIKGDGSMLLNGIAESVQASLARNQVTPEDHIAVLKDANNESVLLIDSIGMLRLAGMEKSVQETSAQFSSDLVGVNADLAALNAELTALGSEMNLGLAQIGLSVDGLDSRVTVLELTGGGGGGGGTLVQSIVNLTASASAVNNVLTIPMDGRIYRVTLDVSVTLAASLLNAGLAGDTKVYLVQDVTGFRTVSLGSGLVGKSNLFDYNILPGSITELRLASYGSAVLVESIRYEVAVALPLDSVTAVAAYSLRKLRSAYDGPAIRIRRAEDNTAVGFDIGFDSLGNLDWAEINRITFGTNLYVTRVYDQTGNGKHANASATSSQPVLLSNQVSGRGTIRFDGSNDFMSIGTSGLLAGVSHAWVSSVARFRSVPTTGQIKDVLFVSTGAANNTTRFGQSVAHNAARSRAEYQMTSRRLDADAKTDAIDTQMAGSNFLRFQSWMNYSAARGRNYINEFLVSENSNQGTSGATSATSPLYATLGGSDTLGRYSDIDMCEVIIGSTDFNSIQKSLDANQEFYWTPSPNLGFAL